jgi:hypothetical protein
MSFIVDTGAPAPFYFSSVAMAKMQQHKLLHEDEDGNDFVLVQARKTNYTQIPGAFEPANIIGLRFVTRVGMTVNSDTFTFVDVPSVF